MTTLRTPKEKAAALVAAHGSVDKAIEVATGALTILSSSEDHWAAVLGELYQMPGQHTQQKVYDRNFRLTVL